MSTKQMVQSWSDKYASALNSPGARGAAAFFAPDADLLPPGPDNLKGADAIQAFWTAVAEHYHNAKLVTVDAYQMGTDYIREIGTYYAEPKSGSGPNLSGKYVFIWRKINEEWRSGRTSGRPIPARLKSELLMRAASKRSELRHSKHIVQVMQRRRVVIPFIPAVHTGWPRSSEFRS